MKPLLFAGLLLVACIPVGLGLSWLIRRAFDWNDRRSYVPPTIHTDVRWWASEDLDITEGRSDPSPALLTLDNTEGQPKPWALSALSDARKDAADTYASLGEFARRVPTGHAWIGMEVEASVKLRQLGRLAVAA